MDIIITMRSDKPIYEQIESQFREMIVSGKLKAGDSIPSMRRSEERRVGKECGS